MEFQESVTKSLIKFSSSRTDTKMSNQQVIQMKEMATFAEMAKMVNIEKLKRRVKMPPWFPVLRRRKDQAALTAVEQQRFLCAFDMINQSGQLSQFVSIHADTAAHRQHGTLRFLPWHRVMLFLVESALESFHPDVTIPYWPPLSNLYRKSENHKML